MGDLKDIFVSEEVCWKFDRGEIGIESSIALPFHIKSRMKYEYLSLLTTLLRPARFVCFSILQECHTGFVLLKIRVLLRPKARDFHTKKIPRHNLLNENFFEYFLLGTYFRDRSEQPFWSKLLMLVVCSWHFGHLCCTCDRFWLRLFAEKWCGTIQGRIVMFVASAVEIHRLNSLPIFLVKLDHSTKFRIKVHLKNKFVR